MFCGPALRLQAVHAAAYDWSLVRPFTASLSFLDALPILAFGFQVRRRCSSLQSAGMPPRLRCWMR